ncbi:MAG: YHS domain-containing (seleno)protein [Ekhidna sp.]
MSLDNSEIFHEKGIALLGYDVVAYFTLDKAVKGMAVHSFEWKEKAWYFISPEHKELFIQHPENYAPQYGGFCAFGISNGYKASTRPEAFTIEDGKLYLNFAKYVRNDGWKRRAIISNRQIENGRA